MTGRTGTACWSRLARETRRELVKPRPAKGSLSARRATVDRATRGTSRAERGERYVRRACATSSRARSRGEGCAARSRVGLGARVCSRKRPLRVTDGEPRHGPVPRPRRASGRDRLRDQGGLSQGGDAMAPRQEHRVRAGSRGHRRETVQGGERRVRLPVQQRRPGTRLGILVERRGRVIVAGIGEVETTAVVLGTRRAAGTRAAGEERTPATIPSGSGPKGAVGDHMRRIDRNLRVLYVSLALLAGLVYVAPPASVADGGGQGATKAGTDGARARGEQHRFTERANAVAVPDRPLYAANGVGSSSRVVATGHTTTAAAWLDRAAGDAAWGGDATSSRFAAAATFGRSNVART